MSLLSGDFFKNIIYDKYSNDKLDIEPTKTDMVGCLQNVLFFGSIPDALMRNIILARDRQLGSNTKVNYIYYGRENQSPNDRLVFMNISEYEKSFSADQYCHDKDIEDSFNKLDVQMIIKNSLKKIIKIPCEKMSYNLFFEAGDTYTVVLQDIISIIKTISETTPIEVNCYLFLDEIHLIKKIKRANTYRSLQNLKKLNNDINKCFLLSNQKSYKYLSEAIAYSLFLSLDEDNQIYTYPEENINADIQSSFRTLGICSIHVQAEALLRVIALCFLESMLENHFDKNDLCNSSKQLINGIETLCENNIFNDTQVSAKLKGLITLKSPGSHKSRFLNEVSIESLNTYFGNDVLDEFFKLNYEEVINSIRPSNKDISQMFIRCLLENSDNNVMTLMDLKDATGSNSELIKELNKYKQAKSKELNERDNPLGIKTTASNTKGYFAFIGRLKKQIYENAGVYIQYKLACEKNKLACSITIDYLNAFEKLHNRIVKIFGEIDNEIISLKEYLYKKEDNGALNFMYKNFQDYYKEVTIKYMKPQTQDYMKLILKKILTGNSGDISEVIRNQMKQVINDIMLKPEYQYGFIQELESRLGFKDSNIKETHLISSSKEASKMLLNFSQYLLEFHQDNYVRDIGILTKYDNDFISKVCNHMKYTNENEKDRPPNKKFGSVSVYHEINSNNLDVQYNIRNVSETSLAYYQQYKDQYETYLAL